MNNLQEKIIFLMQNTFLYYIENDNVSFVIQSYGHKQIAWAYSDG